MLGILPQQHREEGGRESKKRERAGGRVTGEKRYKVKIKIDQLSLTS